MKVPRPLEILGSYLLVLTVLVYVTLDKAGPRGINGYPTFFSVRYLQKTDHNRLIAFYDQAKALREQFLTPQPPSKPFPALGGPGRQTLVFRGHCHVLTLHRVLRPLLYGQKEKVLGMPDDHR
jgi:hypothetical protein